jgi:glycosyltransferase involved in cell wall biosynthesis
MIYATGELSTEKISSHIAACDLLIQPFPDGVSTRRTTVMAALSHGKPVITTHGVLTEAFWKESGAIALAPAEDVTAFTGLLRQLQNDASKRSSLGRAAKSLYIERFDPPFTIAALRNTPIEDFRRAS